MLRLRAAIKRKSITQKGAHVRPFLHPSRGLDSMHGFAVIKGGRKSIVGDGPPTSREPHVFGPCASGLSPPV